jgi:hypothetical protein
MMMIVTMQRRHPLLCKNMATEQEMSRLGDVAAQPSLLPPSICPEDAWQL